MPSLISPASRSRVRIAQVVETNRGETPSSASYKVLPHLDNSALNQTQTFERSSEVKSNRMGGKQVGGNIQVGGTLAVPLKHDAGVRELMESAISGTMAQLTATNASVGGTLAFVDGSGGNDSIAITGGSYSFITAGWQVGDRLVVASSTTAGNDIVYADEIRILAVAAQEIEFATGTVATAENFASGTTITNQSFYGVAGSTRKFFTHEVSYLDLDTVTYEYFRGSEVNTCAINVPTSGEVTAEFAMVGLIGKISETEFDRSNNLSGTLTAGSGTRAAAASTVPFAGSVTGSSLDRGGSLAPEVESLSININNNRAARFAVGQASAAFVEEGDLDIELSFGLYFRDKDVLDDYLAGTRTSMTLTIKDQQDGHRMVFEFPNIVFTGGDKAVNGQVLVQNMTAFAEEDSTYSTKLRVWIQP